MDLFSVDAAEQHEEQKAARHASILFSQRATNQFESFLRGAAHRDEFEARVALVGDDMLKVASELSAGPHALVDAFVQRIAGGAFCDDCRKWKSGPKSLCTCGSDEDNGEGALSDDVSAVGDKESATRVAMPYTNPDTGNEIPTGAEAGLHDVAGLGDKPCGHCGQGVNVVSNTTQCPHCGKSTGGPGLEQLGDQMGQAFGLGQHGAKFRIVATGEDSLGGKGKTAVPFKKEKHAPEVPLKSGETQDVADSASYGDDPDLGKMESIDKAADTEATHTDTWHGTSGQADPVTSHFLSNEEVARALAQS